MKNYLKVFNSDQIFRAVCIGDSTTSQEWCHPNWIDWLNFTFREDEDFEKDWHRKIINSGRDGAELAHYLNNFESEIAFYKPHVVIVSVGLNHLFLKSTPEEVENLLRKLFQEIVNINAELITWSPYAIPEKKYIEGLSKINNAYKIVTEEFNGTYINTFNEFQKYDLSKLFTFVSDGNKEWEINKGETDFLHCNEVGCQIIASEIAKKAFNKNLSDWKFGTMKLEDLKKCKLQKC